VTILVRSSSHTPAELVSALDPEAPPAWSRSARRTSWGCVAWAGESVEVVDRWLILGVPSADPWGWPGHPLGPGELASRMSLFGPDGVRTATGPFLVLDMGDGTVTRPGNGLVPFWTHGRFGSTIQKLAGPNAVPLPHLAHHGFERSARTSLSGRRVRAELLEHRPRATPARDAIVPGPFDRLWSGRAGAASQLRALRHEASRSWWLGRLDDRWLHAPVLERPVVDRLLQAGS